MARPQDGYTEDRIKKMYGNAETDIHFTSPVPVHLTYQSVFVDDAGKLQFRRDVYGLDGRTIAALKSERAVVEPKEERAREVASSDELTPSGAVGVLLRVAVRWWLSPNPAASRHPLSDDELTTGVVLNRAAPVNYFVPGFGRWPHFAIVPCHIWSIGGDWVRGDLPLTLP